MGRVLEALKSGRPRSEISYLWPIGKVWGKEILIRVGCGAWAWLGRTSLESGGWAARENRRGGRMKQAYAEKR